jgi:acetyl esterase
VSVEYSIAPIFSFPAAPEDGYIALTWAVNNAHSYGGIRRVSPWRDMTPEEVSRVFARDRKEYKFSAQALIAPLLDRSLTRLADTRATHAEDLDQYECARNYQVYLPDVFQRMHPYAAPIGSRRLEGLSPALVACAESDPVRLEGEAYAAKLIAARVPVEAARHREVSHREPVSHPALLDDVVSFCRRRLSDPTRKP